MRIFSTLRYVNVCDVTKVTTVSYYDEMSTHKMNTRKRPNIQIDGREFENM